MSAINHLTADDVPVLMTYDSRMDTPISSRSIGIHHPRFGKALKDKMDRLGIDCRVETGIVRGDPRRAELTADFIKQHLLRQPETSKAAPAIVEENVVYGRAGEEDLLLDLARPDGDGPFPAIVFIHGGGWYLGHRKDYRTEIEEAAERGYVAVSVGYRLMTFDENQKETTSARTIFPAQIHDVKEAIRWLRAHADTYHVDAERIGITGQSAGGHLSLLAGLTDAQSQLEGSGGHADQSSRVQAVVNVFGPTDLEACHRTSSVAWIFRLFTGGTPDEVAGVYRSASPVTHVSEDDPPVLTLHGDEDRAVPPDQATRMDEAMKAAGASHTLIMLQGEGHGFGGEARQRATDAMWAFFDEHLKP